MPFTKKAKTGGNHCWGRHDKPKKSNGRTKVNRRSRAKGRNRAKGRASRGGSRRR